MFEQNCADVGNDKNNGTNDDGGDNKVDLDDAADDRDVRGAENRAVKMETNETTGNRGEKEKGTINYKLDRNGLNKTEYRVRDRLVGWRTIKYRDS